MYPDYYASSGLRQIIDHVIPARGINSNAAGGVKKPN